MLQGHKTSFLITLALLFFLPIFFVPGGIVSIDVAKSALLAFGVVVAMLAFLLETRRENKLEIPWHSFMLIIALLPLVYLLSSLMSTPSSLSLFGYNFETGTFGYMLLGSALVLLIVLIFDNTSKILQALATIFISFSIVALFSIVKILTNLPSGSGGFPVWGVFFGNMGNPIGRWTDLAIALGILAIFSIMILGIIPMKRSIRSLCYGIFVLSAALFAVLNFSVASVLVLVVSVILFIYFSTVEKHFFSSTQTLTQASSRFFLKPTFLPVVLAVIALLFVVNPSIPSTGKNLGDWVGSTFKVTNADVRPSFSATLSVSKAVLSEGVLFGSGPNTFGHDWLVHKPVDVNVTPFWGVTFPFGVGFIPTQIASTGVIGILLWLSLFAVLISLGVRGFIKIPESRANRFAFTFSFIGLLYLWVASSIYAPSFTMIILAFIFSGLFFAMCKQIGLVKTRSFDFTKNANTTFLSTLLLAVTAIGTISVGVVAFDKTLATFYFQKAVNLSNSQNVSLDNIENSLNMAIKLAPADTHYVALSRVEFARAQQAAADTSGNASENFNKFQEALSKSIVAAQTATNINPKSYNNWVALGSIYAALVQPPLNVEGSYESAKAAFERAAELNPLSPEVPLYLARLELNHGNNADAARELIQRSLSLKENYPDAYLMLAQLEIQENNISKAIASAERLAILVPNNPAIYFELGVLKYSNADYVGAANALTLALTAEPNYANAKYYLGLSLVKLGRKDEALSQFESLYADNPGNADLQQLIDEVKGNNKKGSS